MKRYNPKEIEPRWQKIWEDQGIYRATEEPSKPKRYVLEYFPYPSGAAMHVGHVRNYTIGDTIARFRRMNGDNVLHPMGWDAFGLPAENYAIKTGVSPRQAIKKNTDKFRQQLMQMGFGYDWSREINSSDPGYYKWTQWFFLLLFKRGLAYQQESLQWWCPFDKTVLANEQVENGKCWRCGNEVEKKSLKQWFFKITDYADRLEKDLENLNWTESIKSMQKNWIGRSVGAEVEFIVGEFTEKAKDTLKFTPELSSLVRLGSKTSTIRLEPKNVTVGDYIKFQTRYSADQVRTFAIAKITKVQKMKLKDIPLDMKGHERYETKDQKLADYRRYYGASVNYDTDFTIYDFELTNNVITVFTTRIDTLFSCAFIVLAPEHKLAKKLTSNEQQAKVATYIKEAQAKSDIQRQEGDRNKTGVFTGAYAINPANDEKVPIWVADFVLGGYGTGAIFGDIHDERDFEFIKKFNIPAKVSIVPIDKKEAEKVKNKEICFTGEGILINSGQFDGLSSFEAREKMTAWLAKKSKAKEQVNYKIRDWLISRQRYWGAPIPIIHCPKDGAVAVPDEDLPVILPEMNSYEPSGDGRSPLARVPEFVNTTCPKCGGKAERETDTMDGFACSSWYFLRFADPHNSKEAFSKEKARFWLPVDDYIGGAEHAVMHLLYARFWTKVMYDAGLISFEEPFTKLRNHGMILAPDGRKMSKSWDNVIAPDDLIKQGYGADSVRLTELFIGPWNQSANWSVEGVGGVFRFLQRAWTLVNEYTESKTKGNEIHNKELTRLQHQTIERVSRDLQELGFNTALAALMEYVNALYKIKARDNFSSKKQWSETISTLLLLLAPFAPHISEELWQQLGHKESIHLHAWPVHDPKYLKADRRVVVVQVNGKVRANIQVPADADEQTIIKVAQADKKIQTYLSGKSPKKTIYVPGKLVNFVV